MSTEVILPKLGFSMTEGELTEWLAVEGQLVTQGEPLFIIESDKSSTEIEAPASGTLKIVAEAGANYEVGFVLGYII